MLLNRPGPVLHREAQSGESLSLRMALPFRWGRKDMAVLKKKSGELLAKEPFGEQVFFTTDGVHLLSSYGSSLIIFSR